MTNIAVSKKLSSNKEEFRTLSEQGFSLIRMRGKQPIEKQWQQWCHKSRSYDDIGFQQNDNAGITCGVASNLMVLDVDDQVLFTTTCKTNGWSVPPTLTVQTGGGGRHYYFRYPADGKEYGNKARKKWGFDIRGTGGCVVASGSIHPNTGKPYRVINGDVNSIVAPPTWMLELYRDRVQVSRCNEHASDTSDGFDGIPKGISERIRNLIENGKPTGERSESMMSVIDALVANGLSDDHIVAIFERYPIGEKYRYKGDTKKTWLQSQIDKARGYVVTPLYSGNVIQPYTRQQSFPIDCFPGAYQAAILEVADAVGTRIEIPALALLSLVGACIGRTRAISPKRGWTEHANLYIALVGPSGIGKTPATNIIFKSVRNIEEHWYQEDTSAPQEESHVGMRQLIVDDATLEAFPIILADNPRGILWNRDELAGMFQDMDRHVKREGGTKSRLMSSYDSGAWIINRADKGKHRRISHATLSIFGTIQPKALTEVFSKRDIEVGLVPRFLFVMVAQDQPVLWSEKEVNQETETFLHDLVSGLLNYDFDDSGKAIEIKLSADAKDTFAEWYDKVQRESWMDVDAEHMQTIAKKLHAQCLRLTIILHCMEAIVGGTSECDPVRKETMERAIQLAKYFKHEKYAVMQLLLGDRKKTLTPIMKHTASAILQLEGEINRGMLPTARITEIVNQNLDELFQVDAISVGKAAASLGLQTRRMPDGKRRGIEIQAEDFSRLKYLLGVPSNPSEVSV